MRKTLLAGLVVMLALAVATRPASALYLKPGELLAHFTDGSSMYVDDDSDPDTPRVPRPPADMTWEDPWDELGTEPQDSDEERVLMDVNQFLQGGTEYYSVPGGELTGLMYDLHLVHVDIAINTAGHTTLDLFYGPLKRNPVPGLGDDPDAPGGSGGVLELWFDPTPEGQGVALFDPLGGGLAPWHWVEGQAAGVRDQYPTVNTVNGTDALGNPLNILDDSTMWLQCVFTPVAWIGEVPIYKHEYINVTTGSGFLSQMFLNIIGGTAAPLFNRDVYGPGRDIAVAGTLFGPPDATYTGSPQDIGNWAVKSSDPAQANIIPEPASLSLLGLSLVGLAVARWRKK